MRTTGQSWIWWSWQPTRILVSTWIVINKKPRHRTKAKNDNQSVRMISIPYIRDTSEKFKRTGERFNIKTVFKSKYTLGNFFRKMKPNNDTLGRSQCIYRIPCKCRREHIGGTSRSLNTKIREYKCNLREGHGYI